MTSRQISLRRGKTGAVQRFSLARPTDEASSSLLAETLKPGINHSRRHQILGDPSKVHQFACIWGSKVGFFTKPVITTATDGSTLVAGNFTDSLGEPYPVTVPLASFQGSITTLVRRGDAVTFGLDIHPTTPDTVGGPVTPARGGRPSRGDTALGRSEPTLERLNYPMAENAGTDDHPVIVALPCFLPVGPGLTFPHLVPLGDDQSFRGTYPLFEVWKGGMNYVLTQNAGHSVTVGGTLFDLPALVVADAAEGPFTSYDVRPSILLAPTVLSPTQSLFSVTRLQLVEWSEQVWVGLGENMEPEAPPPGVGAQVFTPEHFRAAVEPLVNKDKTFGAAGRTAARYRVLLASLPPGGALNPDRMVLPDLKDEVRAYFQVSSSAVAGDDLRELVKSRLNLANASDLCRNKDVTLEPENITLAFSDRFRTFNWLVEKLVSTSRAGAQSVLGLMHFLTPDRDALALVAEGDNEAKTLLMSNATSAAAQLDASKSSKLYSDGRVDTFRHVYEGGCNARCIFSVLVEHPDNSIVVVKVMEYVDLLVDRQGRFFFEAFRHSPYLAVHAWQDVQSILSAFLRVATNSDMYGAVQRGEPIAVSNFQGAIDVADGLITELRAILHGNGLGKFSGTPICALWFKQPAAGPGRVPRDASTRNPSVAPETGSKRQKTLDPAETERRKTLGMIEFDTVAAGTSRLPTINVYVKKRGGKTPERLCMKFLCRGHTCPNPDCKFPHITNIEALPDAERAKFILFVKKQPGLNWVEGKAPAGTA